MASTDIRIAANLAHEYGFDSGAELEAVPRPNGLLLRRAPDCLAKVYVEATTRCNLNCRTCVRNAWDEPRGTMPLDLFNELLEHLEAFPKPVTIFFGGYGEPLAHSGLLEMIRRAQSRGHRVELITNGILLNPSLIRELVDLAVDQVWISIDGLTPDSYADIRRGGQLRVVEQDIRALNGARLRAGLRMPAIGLAFVALKSNHCSATGLVSVSC